MIGLRPLRNYRLIYLATPYSKHPAGIEEAFKDACFLTARLLEQGLKVYCPIAHTHPIATHGNVDPYDHAIWLPFDEAVMERSDAILVAHMLSWEASKGIAHEIDFFTKRGKPVHHLFPALLDILLTRTNG